MPRLNSVGGKFIMGLALILPIFVWQLGKDAFQSFQRYREINNLERQNAAANNLIAGVYEILLERLATNNALQAEQPAESNVLNEIEKRRSAAVQKISTAFTDLTAQEFPNKTVLLNELKAAREKADTYRVKADAAVKQPKGNRDADTVKNLFVSLSELSATSTLPSARRCIASVIAFRGRTTRMIIRSEAPMAQAPNANRTQLKISDRIAACC